VDTEKATIIMQHFSQPSMTPVVPQPVLVPVMCVWVPQNASVVWAPALPVGTSHTQAAAVVDWDDTASSISGSSNNSVWRGGVDHGRLIFDDDDAASSISVSTSTASTISTTSSAVSPRRRRLRPNRKRSDYKGLEE